MNWASLGLAALCGALAGVLSAAVVSDPKENRGRYAGTFVVIFAMLFGLCRAFVLPKYEVWQGLRQAEAELQKIPAFVALKRYEPTTYGSLMEEVKGSLKDGLNEERIIAIFHGRMEQIVKKRLPVASNESVTEYMKAMMTELGELQKQGDDVCYRYLFPREGEIPDGRQYFSQEAQQADLAALGQVIESAAKDPQRVPQDFEVNPKLEPIVQELAGEYGRDLGLLQQTNGLMVSDRRKVCAMTAGLYGKILRLPVKDSGMVLRYLMAKS